MVKGRKEDIFVALLDIEKAYDRVNRKKMFEVYIVTVIERIYDGSM